MPYDQYAGYALEQIAIELLCQLDNPLNLFTSTHEQAREAFLCYVSTYTGSKLALFQEQYGARLESELPVLWPFFLEDLRQGRV